MREATEEGESEDISALFRAPVIHWQHDLFITCSVFCTLLSPSFLCFL